MGMIVRLLEAIRAAVPAVQDISVSGTVVSVFPSEHQAAAQPTIDAFDWSQAAQDAWENAKEPLLKDLNDQAVSAINTNTTFLALANPNNAQTLAQVKALTQQNTRIIRALERVVTMIWR